MSSHIEVTVKKVEPRTVAFLSEKGSFKKIGQTIGRLFGLVCETGYAVAGPPIGVYYSDPSQVPEDELLWEIQVPVGGEAGAAGSGEGSPGIKRVEAYEAASTVHRGPYDTIGGVYGELAGWVFGNGYEMTGAPEEVYLSDPTTTPKDEILTEVRFPVRKA